MNNGAVLFAADVDRVARFYEVLLTMSPVHVEEGLRVIASDRTELVIHGVPPHIMAPLAAGERPMPREDTAMKLFFAVDNLAKAREMAPLLGGFLFPADKESTTRRFVASNACDPEGNVVQFREMLVHS